MKRGLRLISSGAHRTNPELMLPLVACLVPIGEPVTVIGTGFTYREVVVSAGERRGCTGRILMEHVGP